MLTRSSDGGGGARGRRNSLLADPLAAFTAAEAKLTRALSLAPNNPPGHMCLGIVDIWTRRVAEGIARCEHALDLDQNLAHAHSFIGYGKLFIGRAEENKVSYRRGPCG